MHPFTIPPAVSARLAAHCGTPHLYARHSNPRTDVQDAAECAAGLAAGGREKAA